MTQEELRQLYNERLVREKQVYIAKVTALFTPMYIKLYSLWSTN